MLLSLAANQEEYEGIASDSQRLQLSLTNIKITYFNANIGEYAPIYVELLPKDPMAGASVGA